MSKSNTQETGYLKLLYQNAELANIGDAVGLRPSTLAGSFYIALYTTDPTDADSGIEANYTSYARIAVARSVIGFTVSSNVCSNAGVITFPTSTGGSNTITHFGIRTALTGGDLVHYGALTTPRTIVATDAPRFQIGDLTITED